MLATPKAEITITDQLVRKLINSQIHELDNLPLKYMDAGWDNVMYQLGDDYLIRLPRRELGAKCMSNEQVYLDYLPDELPIEIPRVIYAGNPEGDYPWQWSVLPYFPGKAADIASADINQAERLMKFLKCIHKPANGVAPQNEYRGVDLAERTDDIETKLSNIKTYLAEKYSTIRVLWYKALAANPNEEDNWIHGDLHPRNILVDNGKISAIIDWGDITSGDIATDLASIWLLFDDRAAREYAVSAYGINKDLLNRTIGWVIYFATVFYENGIADNPRHLKIGEQAFTRLIEDFG